MDWRKANFVPVLKNDGKQVFKDFHTVSLLPFCREIFDELILNKSFHFFFAENDLISHTCGALRNLLALVQFKKREKHPWSGVNFSKVVGFSLQLY